MPPALRGDGVGVGALTGDAMIAIRSPTAVTEGRMAGTVEAEVIREMVETAGTVKPHEIVTTGGKGVEGVTMSPWQVYHCTVYAGSVAPIPIVPPPTTSRPSLSTYPQSTPEQDVFQGHLFSFS